MESIKFCEGPSFSIFPLMKLLKSNEASFKLICDKWLLFGCSLGLDKDELDSLGEKLKSGRTEVQDIPREMFRLWKDNHEEDANLKVLVDALMDVKVEDLAGAVRDNFGGEDVVAPPASKRPKRMSKPPPPEISRKSAKTVTFKDKKVKAKVDLNTPGKDGYVPLLRAIRDGKSIGSIKKLLDEGANPNVITKDCARDNAAHKVIDALITKKVNIERALAILDLLVSKGFNLINGGDIKGFTPLIYLMHFEDLNEPLLSWFFNNGADFKAVEKECGFSPVLQAIGHRQGVGILRKILEFGGNANALNIDNENALHMSAMYAHESAFEMFLEENLNINEVNVNGQTPIHLLFEMKDLDYQHCLKLLLRKGADFAKECNKGQVPLVTWIKREDKDGGNPFPTLGKMKDRLPITQQMASTALTAIVAEMKRLKKYLPSSSGEAPPNEFVEFIAFLIQDKKAKLRLKDEDEDEDKWKEKDWESLHQFLSTRTFLDELKTSGRIKWNGELTQIKATILGKLDLHTESTNVAMPIEAVIVCLLASKEYKGLVELCEVLKDFC